VSSAIYKLFRQAIAKQKQIVCTYRGKRREVCPIILGHSDGEEKALVYQFGGASSRGLAGAASWRCFFLVDITNVSLRDGPWLAGASHLKSQTCVAKVAFDVNPDSPYIAKKRKKR
jgi:hypothetical protein